MLYMSIPFTWNLPEAKVYLCQTSTEWKSAIVGGPAVQLMPEYLDGLSWVKIGKHLPYVLQRVNPYATRTTTGCPNKCGFCGIGTGKIEGGGFMELESWPNLPIICDNNLFAAGVGHFDKVMDGLESFGWCDFNQGVDARLLTDHHASRIARIKEPIVRLALDNKNSAAQWEIAVNRLRMAGIAKRKIRSYAIIGYKTDPAEAWERCQFVESQGVMVLPMWYHALNCLEKNTVTEEQANWGWTEKDRKHIMGYYYKHRGKAPSIS